MALSSTSLENVWSDGYMRGSTEEEEVVVEEEEKEEEKEEEEEVFSSWQHIVFHQ